MNAQRGVATMPALCVACTSASTSIRAMRLPPTGSTRRLRAEVARPARASASTFRIHQQGDDFMASAAELKQNASL